MVKPFYVDTTGAWVLGFNQQQSAGSQLQAGARAELIPSPITDALSTFGGRIAAQTMQYMFRGDVQSLLNYAAFRPYAMMEAIKFALGDSPAGKIVLNPLAGYSPILYWLAKEFPKTQFIEMDRHKVIRDKRQALDPFIIPDNLRLEAVDLTENDLHEHQLKSVDVLLTLGAYVSHHDYRDMLKYIKNILSPDAQIIAPFPYKAGIENFSQNCTVFGRIVTQPKGAIAETDDLATVFKDTGFTIRNIIKMSELAKQYQKPIPANIEIIAVAQLGDISGIPVKLQTEEIDILAKMNAMTQADIATDDARPFVDVDVNLFRRFPKRRRGSFPKIKPDKND